MSGRSRSSDRCNTCRLVRALCVCGLAQPRWTDTRIVLWMHHRERVHTTNTGRLATMALANSEWVIRGERQQPDATVPRIDVSRGDAFVLFPSDDAIVLDHAFASTLRRPVTLVVPDGNWRQCRRAFRREPQLVPLRRVRLAAGPVSQYRLRRVTREGGLSTLEAIARALGVLEGEAIQRELEALFRIAHERVLWSRGRLPIELTHGSIPETARIGTRA